MANLDTLTDDDVTLIIASLATMRQEATENLWNAEHRAAYGRPARHDAEQLAAIRDSVERIDSLSTRLVASMLSRAVAR